MDPIDVPSIFKKAMAALNVEESVSWMEPIVNYLKDGCMPGTGTEVHRLKIKATHFCLIDGQLYRKSFHKHWYIKGETASLVSFRCLEPSKRSNLIILVLIIYCDAGQLQGEQYCGAIKIKCSSILLRKLSQKLLLISKINSEE